MKKINIVFWGTPDFSIESLNAFYNSPRIKILAIVTQPDKPVKRSGTPQPPPIKKIAKKYKIPVLQPEKLSATSLKSLKSYDFNIIVAYGKIIPDTLIHLPSIGSLNLHPSMLPKYRGPSPIHYALLHGDTSTAITIIEIDKEMDHGPVIVQESITISTDDDYSSLSEKLSIKGSKIFLKATIDYFDKKVSTVPQIHTKATYTKLLSKVDGELDWDASQKVIYNKIRALNPWPGTYTFWNGKRLKILKAKRLTITMLSPGRVAIGKNIFHIGTRDGDMEVLSLQLEGKNVQNVSNFVQGSQSINGSNLPS